MPAAVVAAGIGAEPQPAPHEPQIIYPEERP